MSANLEKISNLRELLQGKFGSSQNFSPTPDEPSGITVDCLDQIASLQRGTVSEMIAGEGSPGLGWLIEQLIQSPAGKKGLALIDGRDSFDPPMALTENEHFLWVRCRHVEEAVKAGDWLLRDGNLPIVILDLQLNPVPELRRIPTSSWYRLRALAEETGTTLFTFTPEKLIPGPARRFRFEKKLSLSVLDEPREKIRISPTLENAKPISTNPNILTG
jgi:hypothetical protein